MMGGKRNITKKIIGWSLASIAVLLITSIVFAWLKIPELLKNEASDFVNEKSDGLYQLSIQSITTDFFPFTLNINDIELIPDNESSKFIQQENLEKALYSLSTSTIKIGGIDFKALFKDQVFHCRKIFIADPVIEVTGAELFKNDSVSMADEIISGIRPLFSDYLKQLKIDQIEFSDANFGVSVAAGAPIQKSQAEQVMLEVKGFITDSTMIFREKRFFETDDVLVKMRNFRNNMGDSLHVTTIDTLEYSLKNTDIRAVGFHLFPLNTPSDKNLLNVSVPEVYVKSKSITNFALSDSMKIKYLEFNNPQIKFYHKLNPEGINLEKLNDFDLYTLVQNQFEKIEIDSFHLQGANLVIYQQPDTVNYQQQFRSIDIALSNFALDSTSAQNRDKIFHADDLEMRVGGYHLRIKNNQHDFFADSMFVSTFTKQLGIKQIKLAPSNHQTFNSRAEVNIQCSELNIEKVDLKRLYYTRQLPTSKIEVIEPAINLQYHLEREKQRQQREPGLLFEMVSEYLFGIYSNLVYIDNGKLSIQNWQNNKLQGYFETDFKFSLTDFTLDSTSLQRTDKFFYATNFDLDFSNYNMRLVDNLHKLKMGKITISSLDQQVHIANLELQPVAKNVTMNTMQKYNRSELYNIKVPEINLKGVQLSNAFFHKNLKIKDFKIIKPVVFFENFGLLRANREKVDLNEFYDLIFNYMEDLDIDRFSIPNGEVTWVNHTRAGKTTSFDNKFSASLFNFKLNRNELNKDRLFFSDNFDISIKDQLFELSDSVHILKAGEIRLSSINSTVSIKDGLLYPIITSAKYKSMPTTFQVAIPKLKLENFDFHDAWYSQNPKIGIFEIGAPKFQIYNQSGKTKSLDLKKYNFPLPNFIHTLKVDEFRINNAEVITYETEGITQHARGNFKFNLTLPQLVIANNKKQSDIESGNIQLQLFDFRVPLGENHSLKAEQLNFNRNQKSIEVGNLKVESFLNDSKNNSFNIRAPKIHFSGFDLNDALNNNRFSFDVIDIITPSVKIDINKKPDKDTLEFLQTLDLFPYVEPYLDQIKVNNLNLENADVNFNWLQKQLFSNKINLGFENILIAENRSPSSLLNSEKFEISTNDLKAQSKNKLYEFTASSLSYNSEKHKVVLSDIAISPLVKRHEFPLKKGFQTDVVNARIAYAEMQGVDEKRWLRDNVLDAASLKIGPTQLNIFRNKRYPFNQQQRPPWPQDLIKEIKQPFSFDSVSLMPSQINYSELTSISEQPGIIEFQNLSFTGGPLSNMDNVLKLNNFLTLNAQTEIYGEALLEARFRFNMTSPEYYHTVTGSLQPMKLNLINNMLERSAPMIIEDGKLNRFDFELSLNEQTSGGKLFMGYDNLKIAVLDYNGQEQQKARFASFWANKMILNSKNPKGKTLEPVSINYERDEKRSIINYWWKSLYSGVKEVLGIEPKEQ